MLIIDYVEARKDVESLSGQVQSLQITESMNETSQLDDSNVRQDKEEKNEEDETSHVALQKDNPTSASSSCISLGDQSHIIIYEYFLYNMLKLIMINYRKHG